jgi:EAL domain-containing protein (putative c-di-GMP-specific phosphodiesterase class I)
VHRLPIDQVKLDRSFASELETSRTGRAVAATVLAMTRQLQVSCSIEGIETASQAIAARTLGFRLMQGYHFGRPLEAEAALGSLLRAA